MDNLESGEGTQDNEEKCNCMIYQGNAAGFENYILSEINKIKQHHKSEIQMIIISSSKDRVFSLFSKACCQLNSTSIICHASVGSLKFERDLKALHFGIDILLVTPGRLPRIYNGNENCFTAVKTVILDQSEILFTRSMLKRTKESLDILPQTMLSVLYTNENPDVQNIANLDTIQTYLKTYSVTLISEQIIISNQYHVNKMPTSGSYILLPDVDSISITKRVAYVLHSIKRLFANPNIHQLLISSYSEYNLNYLLSFLLEYKHYLSIPNFHIICLTQTNIVKEIKPRINFILNSKTKQNYHIVIIINDCLLPLFENIKVDALINLELPLSEELFIRRQEIISTSTELPTSNLFYVTSAQIAPFEVLVSKYQLAITAVANDDDYSEEKKFAEKYSKKKRDLKNGVIDDEDLNLDELSEEQVHSLFYQNEKSCEVKEEPTHFIELNLDDLDVDELNNLDEDLKSYENEQREEYIPNRGMLVPTDLMNSVFNPFFNPGVMHCYNTNYSLF